VSCVQAGRRTDVEDTVKQGWGKVKESSARIAEQASVPVAAGAFGCAAPAPPHGSRPPRAYSEVRSKTLPPVMLLSWSKLIGTPEASVPAAG
jgi:hypothetical protein